MSDAYEPRYGEPRKSSGGGAMKWVLGIGCGCLGLLLLCGGGCGLIMYMGSQQLKKSKPWTESVARASANTDVTNELGSPIEAGFVQLSGTTDMQIENKNGVETGHVDIVIPLKGPKGEGSVHVVGKSATGQWEYSKMEVTTPSGKIVDLLKGAKMNDGKK